MSLVNIALAQHLFMHKILVTIAQCSIIAQYSRLRFAPTIALDDYYDSFQKLSSFRLLNKNKYTSFDINTALLNNCFGLPPIRSILEASLTFPALKLHFNFSVKSK